MRKSFTHEGQRHYIRCKDEIEFEVKKALLIKELEEEKLIESNMLVKDWSWKWMETYKKGECGPATYADYITRLERNILPQIGYMKLKDVKPIHLQNILNSVSHMSQGRINKVYQTMDQIFKAAVNNDLIIKSPVRGLVKPKGFKGSRRAITDQERKIILRVADKHPDGLWLKIMLYCGLRPGETDRIKIAHFDFEKKMLFVDGTKTDNAVRTVPVPDEILQAVRDSGKGPFDYLFLSASGKQSNKNSRNDRWASLKKAIHVEMGGQLIGGEIAPPYLIAEDLVPYCLRHTFCTDLQDAGVPINIAKELMGHSDISITSKIYTHTTNRAIENAAELMEKFRKVAR